MYVNNHCDFFNNVPVILDLLDDFILEDDWSKVIEVKYNPMGSLYYEEYKG